MVYGHEQNKLVYKKKDWSEYDILSFDHKGNLTVETVVNPKP